MQKGFIKKLFNWIKARPIVVASIVLMILLALFFLVFQGKKSEPIDSTPTPQAPSGSLKLTSTIPDSPTYKSMWSSDPITFSFDYPLDPNTISYTVSPSVETKLLYDEETPYLFSVLPLTGWEENQKYTITISKELTSTNKNQLAEEVVFSFTRLPLSQEDIDKEYPAERGY